MERLTADAVWKFTNDPEEVTSSADPGVAAELEVAMAAQAIERTLMGIKTQQLDARTAMLDLERTQQLLAAGGRLSAAADVTQALDNLRSGDANAAGKSLIGTSLDLQRGKSGPADE
ncbi:MAG: hypothetical protein GYA63_07655 [Armatimonadetes bacterium]|nr:hypothetical protein [Armatimonadota bacterium]